MSIQMKKYNDYMSQEYEPVDESKMPFFVDIRAIKAYADPYYRKKRKHGIAAVF